MGWFSDICSSIGNFVSSAVSEVRNAASTAWEKTKEIASKAVGWLADKAENFIDGVKNVWRTVKPFIEKVRVFLQVSSKRVQIPWLKTALILLDKALGALIEFENSPIAKKIDAALKWAIKLAKIWQERTLGQQHEQDAGRFDAEELELAKRHQETFRFAEREVVPDEQRHQLELAASINDFEIAKTDLANAIDVTPVDFEHYLRLRATQKLLNMVNNKFHAAKTVDELSADDLFLVRIASDLVKANPELHKEAAVRLDRVLTAYYGKKLAPFVFEELVASWAKRAEALGEQWDQENRLHSQMSRSLRGLILANKIQNELSSAEAEELAKLQVQVPAQKQLCDDLETRKRDIERYVGAAEGFLQFLEKSREQFEREDREYLIDDGGTVGMLLIDCAEHDKPFSALTTDAQSLITDYANIFREESKTRMKNILEVAV